MLAMIQSTRLSRNWSKRRLGIQLGTSKKQNSSYRQRWNEVSHGVGCLMFPLNGRGISPASGLIGTYRDLPLVPRDLSRLGTHFFEILVQNAYTRPLCKRISGIMYAYTMPLCKRISSLIYAFTRPLCKSRSGIIYAYIRPLLQYQWSTLWASPEGQCCGPYAHMALGDPNLAVLIFFFQKSVKIFWKYCQFSRSLAI